MFSLFLSAIVGSCVKGSCWGMEALSCFCFVFLISRFCMRDFINDSIGLDYAMLFCRSNRFAIERSFLSISQSLAVAGRLH